MQGGRSVHNKDSLWVVIHMTHSLGQAEHMKELLTREGFMVRTRPAGEESYYEVLALTSEAREARDILQDSCL
jgi:hypothetical protein